MNARNAALATICSAEEEGLNDIDKELEEAVEKRNGCSATSKASSEDKIVSYLERIYGCL